MKIRRATVETTYFVQADDVVYISLGRQRTKPGPRYRVVHRLNSPLGSNNPDGGHWQVESDMPNHWRFCDPEGRTHKRIVAAVQAMLAKEAGETLPPKGDNVIDLMEALRKATEAEKC